MKNSISKYIENSILAFLMVGVAVFVSCEEDDSTVPPNQDLGPVSIETYYPTSGKESAGVIISGTNFSAIASENKVWFNGVEATIRSVSNSTILTSVPVGATTGDVTVSVKSGEAIAGPSFTVLLPSISSLSPNKGGVGESVTITGENFDASPEENKVWFNGVQATITEASETSLTVEVPGGADTGTVSVQVKNGTVVTGPSFEVTQEITLQVALSHPDDDVEEAATGDFNVPAGTMDLGSSDLELGEIDGDYGPQVIGVRFRGVNIPNGANIISANIVFMVDDTGSGPVNLRIHGENIGNSPENTADLFNTSSRPKTTASALWTVAPWTTVGDKGPDQTTIDLAAIVQEIVNRGDWNANNAMNFIFTQEGDNSPTGGDGREAETFGGAGQEEEAPILTIVYEL